MANKIHEHHIIRNRKNNESFRLLRSIHAHQHALRCNNEKAPDIREMKWEGHREEGEEGEE
jgi:hypothetical protein